MKYIWDNSTVIYYLKNHFPTKGELFIDLIIETNRPSISVITEIELL